MEKPKGFIHLMKHRRVPGSLVLVVGRIRIPLAWLLTVYGVLLAALFVVAIILSSLWGPGNYSPLFLFLWGVAPGAIALLIWLVHSLASWTIDSFKAAAED